MNDVDYIIAKIGWIAALAQLYKEGKLSSSDTRGLMEGTKRFNRYNGITNVEVDMEQAFVWYEVFKENGRIPTELPFQKWIESQVMDGYFTI